MMLTILPRDKKGILLSHKNGVEIHYILTTGEEICGSCARRNERGIVGFRINSYTCARCLGTRGALLF